MFEMCVPQTEPIALFEFPNKSALDVELRNAHPMAVVILLFAIISAEMFLHNQRPGILVCEQHPRKYQFTVDAIGYLALSFVAQ
jgi:hypothetical protein